MRGEIAALLAVKPDAVLEANGPLYTRVQDAPGFYEALVRHEKVRVGAVGRAQQCSCSTAQKCPCFLHVRLFMDGARLQVRPVLEKILRRQHRDTARRAIAAAARYRVAGAAWCARYGVRTKVERPLRRRPADGSEGEGEREREREGEGERDGSDADSDAPPRRTTRSRVTVPLVHPPRARTAVFPLCASTNKAPLCAPAEACRRRCSAPAARYGAGARHIRDTSGARAHGQGAARATGARCGPLGGRVQRAAGAAGPVRLPAPEAGPCDFPCVPRRAARGRTKGD